MQRRPSSATASQAGAAGLLRVEEGERHWLGRDGLAIDVDVTGPAIAALPVRQVRHRPLIALCADFDQTVYGLQRGDRIGLDPRIPW